MTKRVEPRKRRSGFGMYYDFEIPEDCDVVIVALNFNGLMPVHLCLPHQVYVRDVKELIKEEEKRLGRTVQQVTVIPARSKEYIYLNKYGEPHETQKTNSLTDNGKVG